MSSRRRWGGMALVVTLVVAAGCSGGDDEAKVNRELNEGPERIDYGDDPDTFGELWLPIADDGAAPVGAPVVVLIHGGFWREGFSLDLMDPLVPSLLDEGFAVWNIEYRAVGSGGGYPQTFVDAAAAIDKLADLPERFDGVLDLGNVATVGHSAGGHLAVWLASRRLLPVGVPGVDPEVIPETAVSQAGVLDLIGCVEQGIGGTACSDLVGVNPSEDALRYAQTSPAELLPIDAEVIAIHGADDVIVPVSQSEAYVERASAAGVNARLEVIDGADHFSNLDPTHPAWLTVVDALTS